MRELFRKFLDSIQELDDFRFAGVVEDGHRLRHHKVCPRLWTAVDPDHHHHTTNQWPERFHPSIVLGGLVDWGEYI